MVQLSPCVGMRWELSQKADVPPHPDLPERGEEKIQSKPGFPTAWWAQDEAGPGRAGGTPRD